MNKSLHIGLNRVSPAAYGGWDGRLNGCINDSYVMAAIAKDNFQVHILHDSEATVKRVADALHVFAADTVPGDTVLITYSGHGGQVLDYSKDESDGRDETWCLFDGMLLDDDLHLALSKFKKGVRIIVVSDSCHSGTVVKASFDIPNVVRQQIKAAPWQACRAADSDGFHLPKSTKRPRIKASVVLLSGCQDNQFSWDGAQNGLFTEKLHRVFVMGSFKGNYSALRREVGRLMPPEQSPGILFMGSLNKKFIEGPAFSTL